MRDYKATVGTVIHATHRAQDLVPAFLDELNRLDSEAFKRTLESLHTKDRGAAYYLQGALYMRNGGPEAVGIPDDHEFWDSEDCAFFLNETLMDALNEQAPFGLYFGAHQGDGSDFGFWPDYDSLEDDPEVLVVSKKDGLPLHIMSINDHGNVTLWEVELTPLWDCV